MFILKSASELSQMECGHHGNFFSNSHLEFYPIVVSDGLRSLGELLKSHHSTSEFAQLRISPFGTFFLVERTS